MTDGQRIKILEVQCAELQAEIATLQQDIANITEHSARREKFLEEKEYRMLAFVVHRFCGGKIEYTVEEIMPLWWDGLDIQRVASGNKITYTTRLGPRNAESPEPL